jgi:hypothetical protein
MSLSTEGSPSAANYGSLISRCPFVPSLFQIFSITADPANMVDLYLSGMTKDKLIVFLLFTII